MSGTDDTRKMGNAEGSFSLPKHVKERVKGCCTCPSDVISYLWMHIGEHGIAQWPSSVARAENLTLDDWLNVVDEAASCGVSWLVISTDNRLSAEPDILKVCQWAQSTHGMTVGIHTSVAELSQEEINMILRLDGVKTRLFVPEKTIDSLRHLELHGVKLRSADPKPGEQQAPCTKPSNMVFVNPDGVLYTCGLVEGKNEYCLGNIFNGSIGSILTNPRLPHVVGEGVPRDGNGCDGCPPLMAESFASE